MHETVYRVLRLLWELVGGLPIGTNLALLHLLWMLTSGRLLETRGAVIPGLAALGLGAAAARRAWAALGHGRWTSAGAWRLSAGGGGRDRVLAAAAAGLPDHPLRQPGRHGYAGDPGRDRGAGGERRGAAAGAAEPPGGGQSGPARARPPAAAR
jgi:hypothetical protein